MKTFKAKIIIKEETGNLDNVQKIANTVQDIVNKLEPKEILLLHEELKKRPGLVRDILNLLDKPVVKGLLKAL